MRRFRWYFLDRATEGVLFSSGHVAHDIDDWKGTYHYLSFAEFVRQYAPEHIEWLDFEGRSVGARLRQGGRGLCHVLRTQAFLLWVRFQK